MTSISTFRFHINLCELYVEPFSGRIANGAFLEFLRKHDEELSRDLHEGHGRRPYTITSFNYGRIGDDRTATFKVNTYDKRVTTALMEIVMKDSKKEIFIIDRMCEIFKIEFEKHQVPELSPIAEDTAIRLRFQSPVVFANSNRDSNTDPYPHVDVIWEQMLKTYSRLVEDLSDNEIALFIRKALDQLATPHFVLKSKHLQLGHKIKVTGFVGTILFVVEDPEDLDLLMPVVKLTQAWGLGGKTTMGFGEIDVSIKPPKGDKNETKELEEVEAKPLAGNGTNE